MKKTPHMNHSLLFVILFLPILEVKYYSISSFISLFTRPFSFIPISISNLSMTLCLYVHTGTIFFFISYYLLIQVSKFNNYNRLPGDRGGVVKGLGARGSQSRVLNKIRVSHEM